jgi:ATP-dependent Lon protease
MIEGYAREPGVRGLENHIKKVIRKSVKRMVAGEQNRIRIDADDLHDLLGRRQFTDDVLFKDPTPGVVMGLAWTSLGGDTLHIEASGIRTGKAGFKQTGQLGDVMVESSEIAYTYVQAFLDADEVARDFFQTHFVHLHVPAGATPKDGPSAGITMAAALYSLVRGIPARKRLAMTGELSLTGKVMEIGGVKEKTLAAKRAKVRHLVFPEENRKDFEGLPDHVRKGLTPHYVSTFEEVVAVTFPGRKVRP